MRDKPYLLRKVGFTFFLAATLIIPSFPGNGSAAGKADKNDADRTKSYATGFVQNTPQEQKWLEEHSKPAKDVKVSKMGIERINHARKAKGLPLIDENLAGADAGVLAGAGEAVAQVDNSTLKYFPPIANQGSLGSCVSFASTYYMGTYMTAMARDWDAKNGGNTFRLSPTWTYNFMNGGTTGGTTIGGTLQLLMNNGAATWSEVPYSTANYKAWSTNPQTWRNALSNKFLSTGTVSGLDTQDGLNSLKQFLTNGYILEIATYISSWQYTTVKNDPATTLDDALVGQKAAYYMNGTSGGHAMTIVGYDDNIWVDINNNGLADPGEKGALKIANSWGSGWGNSGYVWLAYDALKAVTAVPNASLPGKIPAFSLGSNNAYWITANTSYTPRLTAEFTVNTAKRNELSAALGYSELSVNTLINTITPKALSNNGGAFAFDGTTTATDATFVLDYTDLIKQSSLDVNHNYNWYLTVTDNTYDDAALTIKSFVLKDNLTNTVITSTYAFPGTVNGSNVALTINDNLGAANPLPTIVDDINKDITYNVTWSKYSSSRDYGGSESFTSVAGNYAQYTFTGSTIRYIGMKQPNMGKVDVYLDGVLIQADIDCYSSTTIKQALIFSASGLTNGTHTIRVVAKGTKNPASTNIIAAIDDFQSY
ncbi:C1 family peptidase [Paenibacillus sp. Soil787]|uniref:C1 family peptidase n=1 Tax=Paenibacillus sp. Soil787 TaxID=1736411 RepID=UPI0006F271E6|nr:C1 family peptidase [Paenibacillus sp. Soil787]KRF42999.1 hypothetical protein ASG93_20835 [Paenibacillus sp. Soil787]